MAFHQRLKHERLVKGWSIEQLSQASGVTVNRISMLERNLVEMVSDSLKDCLAKALEVDFNAPPSVAADAAAIPVATPAAAPASAPAVPAAPEPVALHLSRALQTQLEAAARSHGRSLHGEILARLEVSLAATKATANPASPTTAHPAAAVLPAASPAALQLTEADLDYLTEQVALRLQARG
jgi:transcriptional regulator with XRE-family HTH domain